MPSPKGFEIVDEFEQGVRLFKEKVELPDGIQEANVASELYQDIQEFLIKNELTSYAVFRADTARMFVAGEAESEGLGSHVLVVVKQSLSRQWAHGRKKSSFNKGFTGLVKVSTDDSTMTAIGPSWHPLPFGAEVQFNQLTVERTSIRGPTKDQKQTVFIRSGVHVNIFIADWKRSFESVPGNRDKLRESRSLASRSGVRQRHAGERVQVFRRFF
ncbi:hypothetical protein T439DRAFT_347650 [Meredithblackwellia eburnea MCA 4105]